MPLTIDFSPPLNYTPPTPATVSYSSVEVIQMRDNPQDKSVTVNLLIQGVGRKELVLWRDEAYDAIGQWTDSDVTARITELLSNGE